MAGQHRTGHRELPLPGVVHLPGSAQRLGRTGGVICLALALVSLFWQLVLAICFAMLALCFGSLALAYRNWCILYDDSGFKSVNLFGNVRRYTYCDIRGIRGSRLYLQNRSLILWKRAVGRMEFITAANRHYRAAHGNRPIPLLRKKRRALFAGHVVKPSRYIAPYCAITSLFLCVILLICLGFIPATPENTTVHRLTFYGYRVEGNDLWLESSAQARSFLIRDYSRMEGRTRDIPSLCDGETELYVWTTYVRNRHAFTPSYYCIHELTTADGTEYYTFRQDNDRSRKLTWIFLTITGALFLGWMLYLAAAIFIGCHPEKFKPKTVYRFFKKGTIYWKG